MASQAEVSRRRNVGQLNRQKKINSIYSSAVASMHRENLYLESEAPATSTASDTDSTACGGFTRSWHSGSPHRQPAEPRKPLKNLDAAADSLEAATEIPLGELVEEQVPAA